MRLGTVRIRRGAPRAVGLVDGHVIDLSEAALDLGLVSTAFPESVRQLLELKPYTDPLIADLERAVRGRDDLGSAAWAYLLDDVTFMSPVAPGKVLLVGGNHKGSATRPLKPEIQDEWPRPMYFMKPGSSVLGHGGTVEAWQVMRPVHTEGEVCLVIGRRARHVRAADAWSVVAGVSLLNDMFAGRFVLQDGTTLVHQDRGRPAAGGDGHPPDGPVEEPGRNVPDRPVDGPGRRPGPPVRGDRGGHDGRSPTWCRRARSRTTSSPRSGSSRRSPSGSRSTPGTWSRSAASPTSRTSRCAASTWPRAAEPGRRHHRGRTRHARDESAPRGRAPVADGRISAHGHRGRRRHRRADGRPQPARRWACGCGCTSRPPRSPRSAPGCSSPPTARVCCTIWARPGAGADRRPARRAGEPGVAGRQAARAAIR